MRDVSAAVQEWGTDLTAKVTALMQSHQANLTDNEKNTVSIVQKVIQQEQQSLKQAAEIERLQREVQKLKQVSDNSRPVEQVVGSAMKKMSNDVHQRVESDANDLEARLTKWANELTAAQQKDAAAFRESIEKKLIDSRKRSDKAMTDAVKTQSAEFDGFKAQ